MTELRVLSLLCAVCVVGCTRARPEGNSSETHFLAPCDADECGSGLQCLCGVCTAACTDDDGCSDLPGYAECNEPRDARCDQARICDAACQVEADCEALGEDFVCQAGRCGARIMSPAPADGGTSCDGCEWDGSCLEVGERFRQACNECFCQDNGSVGCTTAACNFYDPPCQPGSCEVDGRCIWDGANGIPAADGCNQCACSAGVYSCTEEGCGSGADCAENHCEVFGKCYAPGTRNVPAPDGCNTCLCDEGNLVCTERGCGNGIGGRCDRERPCDADLLCLLSPTDRPDDGFCAADCDDAACPAGTECYPLSSPTDRVCLRPCAEQKDCDPLGSLCDPMMGFCF